MIQNSDKNSEKEREKKKHDEVGQDWNENDSPFVPSSFDIAVIPLREKKTRTLPRSDGCGLNNFEGMLFVSLLKQFHQIAFIFEQTYVCLSTPYLTAHFILMEYTWLRQSIGLLLQV